MRKGRVTFLCVFNKDGSQRKLMEIIDIESKRSLGIFEIAEHTQSFVGNPIDMPKAAVIYKDSFDILGVPK